MITKDKPLIIQDLNIHTAFKVTWISFMQMKELTYTAVELKNNFFKDTKFTRLNISIAECNQYAILYLKQNKINVEHMGVQILLATTGDTTYLVLALRKLFL